MSRLGLGLAACLSFLTLVLPLPVEVESALLSRTLLCALPWIACSGLAARHVTAWSLLLPGLLFLLVLAAGCGLDLASGGSKGDVGFSALAALGMTSLLAWTASTAARGERTGRYALLFGLYVLLPLAWRAMPGPLPVGSDLRALLSWSPLGWCWQRLFQPVAVDPAGPPPPGLLVSLLAFAGLCRVLCGAREAA